MWPTTLIGWILFAIGYLAIGIIVASIVIKFTSIEWDDRENGAIIVDTLFWPVIITACVIYVTLILPLTAISIGIVYSVKFLSGK